MSRRRARRRCLFRRQVSHPRHLILPRGCPCSRAWRHMPRAAARDIEDALAPLRRSLEADRFGFVAHVLAVRDGCTGQNCKALSLLRDPSRVRANLRAQTIDRYVDHYQEVWAKAPERRRGRPSHRRSRTGPHKLVNIDFPTAASIPPVSIMNPEPTGPVLPGVAAAAAANPNPQASASRRARRQAANPPPQAVAQPTLAGSSSPSRSGRSRSRRRRDRCPRRRPARRFSSIRLRPARARRRCAPNELSVRRAPSANLP